MKERMERNYPAVREMKEKYFMVKKLGGGSFGTVYLVKLKEKKDKLYAAKHQRCQDQKQRRYVRRELELLEVLRDHTNILRLKGFYESGLESVIVTEYLPGGELFDRISSKTYELTESKCQGFMRQVLQGLIYIHSKVIVHLDLKPNNIVCVSRDSSDQRVKIIDFGLARLEQDCAGLGMCGTMEFMSPEVLSCRGATRASDIWSIGVIIFMMVTGGYSPFYSSKKYKMQRMILKGNYNIEQFGGVSRQAKHLVRDLLLPSPASRPSAQDCLNHPWFAEETGTPGALSDPEESPVRRLETEAMRRWLARRRWIRACHIVRATIRLNNLSLKEPDIKPEFFSSEEVWI